MFLILQDRPTPASTLFECWLADYQSETPAQISEGIIPR
jgi:hypothetical protein